MHLFVLFLLLFQLLLYSILFRLFNLFSFFPFFDMTSLNLRPITTVVLLFKAGKFVNTTTRQNVHICIFRQCTNVKKRFSQCNGIGVDTISLHSLLQGKKRRY